MHVVVSDTEYKLLRTAVDRIPSMLAFWDTDRRCRLANRAYERWFGVSPETLIGMHMEELLGPLYAMNLPYIEAALRGESQQFERTIPDPKGGPPRHSLANYIPEIVDGVVQGFFVLVSDFTAIKNAELALRESEERFRLTIDEAPIGMALVAPDGRFIRVNHALCDILGYTADELTGLTFHAITHADDLDIDLALARKLAAGEIPRYKLGKRYIRKDGTIVDVMLSGSALRGPDGAPIHYIAQIEDISEQKRRETAQRFLAKLGPVLAESLDYEETLRRIADVAVEEIADLCIVESVEDGDDIRRVRVASRDPDKAWICDVLATLPLDRNRPHLVRHVLQTRRPFVLDRPSRQTIERLSQGETHAHALLAADIRSLIAVPLLAGDQLLGVIALISSTASHDAAADLRLAEELARRASLSIRSARLYRAARRATQARDEVLGVVAHDLRNPLNSIMLHATMLRDAESKPGAAARAGAAIARSAERMNRLIEDLLDVVRMDAGTLSVNAEPMRVADLLTEAVETQRSLAQMEGLELRLELPSNLPAIHADRDRLAQIFENLIGNARKFTPPGGRITARVERRAGEIAFHVIDTGTGIAADQLPHLFDRFWQGERGARHGAGLGLAIVKGIVEAHGGRISVESTPGRGTHFQFTIPIAAVPARSAAKQGAGAQPTDRVVRDRDDIQP